MNNLILGSVKGRHEIPVNEFVFEGAIEDPTDLDSIRTQIHNVLKHCNELTLYVTGLTIVTTEICHYCFYNNIALTLMHFNSISGEYFAEVMLDREEAAYRKKALEDCWGM